MVNSNLVKRTAIIITTAIIVNILQAWLTPISEDEAYYWLWSQNLDWGYFDHPPMIAWWISDGYGIFQNELGIRLLTVLFNGLSLLLLWKTLRPGTLKQIKLFWLILASVPVIHIFGFLATPDAPLLFFTVLYLFSLKSFLEKNSMLFTVMLAFSIAGLMYSKYHGILVIVFTLLPVIKMWWKNPKFYLAALSGFILYFPHIWWVIQHDFMPIRYHFLERSSDEHFELRKLTNYLGIYFLGAAPLLSYFIFNSILKYRSKTPFQKSISWLAILPGIFFFLSIFKDNVQPQWLLISFVAMALLMYFHYSQKDNLKWIFRLGFASLIIILVLRILLAIPGISPFYKNKSFAENVAKFHPENAVFEKYQEASVYKFYNPEEKVAVHRTLGNRKSQFSLWEREEDFYGKAVTYISPWIKGEDSFKGFKNRDYYLKKIADYQTFELIQIEIPDDELSTETNRLPATVPVGRRETDRLLSEVEALNLKSGETVRMKIKITNGHQHPVTIGGNSLFQLNINYYKDLQYEIEYAQDIKTDEFTLLPGESKELKIEFQNTTGKGTFKARFGIRYRPVGTSYLSNAMEVNVN